MIGERRCGKCSLCCKLLQVDLDDGDKPANTWCRHAKPGAGCSIYPQRPRVCVGYRCGWLKGSLPDYWEPIKCRMTTNETNNPEGTIPFTLWFHVDPGCPNRWREEPFISDIRRWARDGLNSGVAYTKVQSVRPYLILPPDQAIEEDAGATGVVLRTGVDRWEYVRTKSLDDAQKFGAELDIFRAKVNALPAWQRLEMIEELMKMPGAALADLALARQEIIKQMTEGK